MKSRFVALSIASIWILFNEFLRNQLVLSDLWKNHYKSMGLDFPANTINGLVWLLWSITFSVVILVTSKSYGDRQTIILSWVIGFVLMWLVIGNLGVLPLRLLYVAVPWSLLEVTGAVAIFKYKKRR